MICAYCGSRFVNGPEYANKIFNEDAGPSYFCTTICLTQYVRNEDNNA